MSVTYELVMQRGPTPGVIFPLSDKSLTIGRDSFSDIVINDPEVSRQHALLICSSAQDFSIQDLGSTNGTYVNGKRLEASPVILQSPGLIIMGGAVTLVFRERARTQEIAEDSVPLDHAPSASDLRDVPVRPYKAHEPQLSLDSIGKRADPDVTDRPSSQPKREKDEIQQRTDIRLAAELDAPVTDHWSPRLLIGLVLLLLCCCLGLIIFLGYLGGDWYLRELGIVP